ncbi:MAG: hypothetical protein KIT27_11145 [Legionellales bacterium]|nr:hypothetical protein [Legionellales bacterium]
MMKVKYEESLVYKIEQRMEALEGKVLLFRDVSDLADKTQVSRALRCLVKKSQLVKIGYGVFAKPLFYSERLNSPIIDFDNAALEALNKLNIKWELGKAFQDYNNGLSTQVPVRMSVKLNSRCSRNISYDGVTLRYE